VESSILVKVIDTFLFVLFIKCDTVVILYRRKSIYTLCFFSFPHIFFQKVEICNRVFANWLFLLRVYTKNMMWTVFMVG
jgi:hypothetical protein